MITTTPLNPEQKQIIQRFAMDSKAFPVRPLAASLMSRMAGFKEACATLVEPQMQERISYLELTANRAATAANVDIPPLTLTLEETNSKGQVRNTQIQELEYAYSILKKEMDDLNAEKERSERRCLDLEAQLKAAKEREEYYLNFRK